ncbi:heptaprenyl diphosphate synthase component 1 [Staphylococcus hyicus]|uniref:heptaprenyl diphosphate synthase component 1 n=1 Tax=Staphylococcus hyicus TaxID=1284 RepID=UPI00057E01F6|nr:heptaprenyl diphosphate synthase component 1 [Staphylococcus hyicus]AJC96177.1 heptaprenyl diphosphate synthase subunit 1 [Staphylococcus hyicus]MCQ9290811.1 heptaprenyl diphosphate synthase component 1 [Staphylococcus hyicus]MCQ9306053.1 heptaprenyl diphosphate synthase component 1 [Staphylococcus hyicus]MCQ9308465.1 heptaprenyl diphosphate synthase component 1 [Staphylococcus hyicus]MCQ9310887.1 heptaprenyl diphosphate synthase component 1 [Staphylococcus hyicus]
MHKTFERIEKQMDQILFQIHKPNNVYINHDLSVILDCLSIPELSKDAVFSIYTAMTHLDRISYFNYDRDAILIGDLYSAHYYHLIAQIQSTHFQKLMSQALVHMNALKSNLQQNYKRMSQAEILESIMNVEMCLLDALIDIYELHEDKAGIRQAIFNKIKVEQLTYLNFYTEEEISQVIQTLHSKYPKWSGLNEK